MLLILTNKIKRIMFTNYNKRRFFMHVLKKISIGLLLFTLLFLGNTFYSTDNYSKEEVWPQTVIQNSH